MPPELAIALPLNNPDTDLLTPGLIHEMRQPLTGVRAGLAMLADATPEVNQTEAWSLIQGQLKHLEELFRCYQEFLDPNRQAEQRFLVGPVVDNALELLRYRMKPLGSRVTVESPPRVTAVGASKALLHALTNLLNNALDAMENEPDEGRLAIRVITVAGAADTVEIRVSDEGIGIPAHLRQQIFEPRMTTKLRGSGLGLSIARRMLEAAGGSLTLAERWDPLRIAWASTEFIIRLAPRGLPVPEPLSVELWEPAPETARPRALVVDDEPLIGMLLEKALTREGWEVEVTNNGNVAGERLRAAAFDFLVVDKNLPGGSGVAVAELARHLYPSIGVMLMTGYPSRDSALKLFTLHVDEYISKPFETQHVVRRMRQILDRARLSAAGVAVTAKATRILVCVSEGSDAALLHGALIGLGLTPEITTDVGGAFITYPDLAGVVTTSLDLTVPVYEALWERQARGPLPVVLLCESDGMDETIAAISVGATEQLTRPIDEEHLNQALRRAFRIEGGLA